MRSDVVIGAALALGLALPAGTVAAQGRAVPTVRQDLTSPPPAPAPGPPSFGSVPSAEQRIRIETRAAATGATRETRITIQGPPSTAGASPGMGARTGFGSVPAFDRQVRITTEGTPVETRVEVPIVIVPRP